MTGRFFYVLNFLGGSEEQIINRKGGEAIDTLKKQNIYQKPPAGAHQRAGEEACEARKPCGRKTQKGKGKYHGEKHKEHNRKA